MIKRTSEGENIDKNAKVRVSEVEDMLKKFVLYEEDVESEDYILENMDEFRESEGIMYFYGGIR